jgi:hypothetical protein
MNRKGQPEASAHAKRLQVKYIWGGIFSPFMQSYIFLFFNILQYTYSSCQDGIGQKKAISHSLAITRDTQNGDRQKRSGLHNWGAIDRTSAPCNSSKA